MSTMALSRDTVERFREPAFAFLLLAGTFVFAIGGAFLVIGVAINTQPPAPYVDPLDKQLLIVISIVAMLIGLWLIRLSAHVVG